jgi:primase-polymerase (primpol)-like protein
MATYTEISPSGTGLHLIARGQLPPGWRHKKFSSREHHGIEVYGEGSAHYLTMTGVKWNDNAIKLRTRRLAVIHAEIEQMFPSKPQPKPIVVAEPEDVHYDYDWQQQLQKRIAAKKGGAANASFALTDEQLIEKAKQAANGAKFTRVWNGDKSEYKNDDSRADLALCGMLSFWTDDPARIDRLFRQSKLMRGKWAKRADYRDMTIGKAIR